MLSSSGNRIAKFYHHLRKWSSPGFSPCSLIGFSQVLSFPSCVHLLPTRGNWQCPWLSSTGHFSVFHPNQRYKYMTATPGHNDFQLQPERAWLGRAHHHLKDNWGLIGWLRLLWGQPPSCAPMAVRSPNAVKAEAGSVLSMTDSK